MTDTPLTYTEELDAWRRTLDDSLRREEGWLALVGLHWLKPGVNRVGGGPSSAVALPPARLQGELGVIVVEGGSALFRALPGAEVTCDGVPVGEIELRPDTSDSPTRIRAGSLTLALIRRGERLGLRVWDREAPARAAFAGRRWYPIDARWRLTGAFEPYATPRRILVPDATGGVQSMAGPGEVVFDLFGKRLRLVASEEDEGALFLIFADATTGVTTYPAGRYLYTSPPAGGRVEIDFNRAYNPPCAFTAYATCPLPLPENHLPIAIGAGERYSPSPG